MSVIIVRIHSVGIVRYSGNFQDECYQPITPEEFLTIMTKNLASRRQVAALPSMDIGQAPPYTETAWEWNLTSQTNFNHSLQQLPRSLPHWTPPSSLPTSPVHQPMAPSSSPEICETVSPPNAGRALSPSTLSTITAPVDGSPRHIPNHHTRSTRQQGTYHRPILRTLASPANSETLQSLHTKLSAVYPLGGISGPLRHSSLRVS